MPSSTRSPVRRRVVAAALVIVLLVAIPVAGLLLGVGDGRPGRGDGPASAPGGRALPLGGGPAGSRELALVSWRYRADPRDLGRRRGWADGRWGAHGRRVRVPYVPTAGNFSGPGAQRDWEGSVGWFARTVDAPSAGYYALAFESAHHRATVYVDGKRVRDHVGAYEPFSARTPLSRGRHRIAVRVDWRDPEARADTGYSRGWYNWGGLNRPVTLTRLGPSEIGAPSIRTRLVGRDAARIDIGVRVRNRAAPRRMRVTASLRRGGRAHPLDLGDAVVPRNGSRTLRASILLARPDLWAPGNPALYDLEVSVPGEASLRRRVGLREIRWDGGRLRLNGRPLDLRGASVTPDAGRRGDALTPGDDARTIRELKAVGANATRAQFPLSDHLLDRLDEAGILVWQEIGPWEGAKAWHSKGEAAVQRASQRALATAEQEALHPSVLAWTLTNEIAFQGQPEQVDYVLRTIPRLKAIDRSRPVAADLWGRGLPTRTGPVYEKLDAIGFTEYSGWYEVPDATPAQRTAFVRRRIAGLRSVFPDKPLVLTEFGGAGTARIPGRAFGSLRHQADLLAQRIRVLRNTPGLSGALVWSLRDYVYRPEFEGGSILEKKPDLDLTPGLNEKGLFFLDGSPKPALRAVRDAYAAPR